MGAVGVVQQGPMPPGPCTSALASWERSWEASGDGLQRSSARGLHAEACGCSYLASGDLAFFIRAPPGVRWLLSPSAQVEEESLAFSWLCAITECRAVVTLNRWQE